MVPQQETLTRRQLFEKAFDRIKLTAIAAPLLAACAPSTGVAGATDSKKGTSEATKPAELASQARDLVLNRWLSLLNSPQRKSENGYDIFLDIRVKNMEEWRRNIPSVFTNQGSRADDPMIVSWTSGQTFSTSNGLGAWKFTGEMEIKEVRVVLTNGGGTGTPDDNGFQWGGEFRLDWRARSHVNNYSFGELNKNQASLMSWLAASEINPFPDFSPWENESFHAKLVLQKGTWNWEKDPFKRAQWDPPRGLLESLSLPFSALYQGGPSGCKSYDSCKQVRMPAFK